MTPRTATKPNYIRKPTPKPASAVSDRPMDPAPSVRRQRVRHPLVGFDNDKAFKDHRDPKTIDAAPVESQII